MIKNSVSYIANYLWMESIKNLSAHLTEAELKNFGSNDYYYLTTIYYLGKPNFSQVAETLRLTRPAITVFVHKLAKMGLLEKIQSEEDKRMHFVCITQKGKDIIEGDEELYKKLDLLIKSITADPEKYRFVENLLEQLVTHLSGDPRLESSAEQIQGDQP